MARMRERFGWSQRIRDALDEDRFELWEQPILDLRTARGHGRSSCCACASATRSSRPGEFLEVAERFGQIQAIDRWVVAQAVRLLAARRAAGEDPTVEINLSGASITDEEVMEHITAEVTNARDRPDPHRVRDHGDGGDQQRGAGPALRPATVGSRVPVRPRRLRGRLRLVLLPQAPALRRDQDRRRLHPRAARVAPDQATVRAIVDIARALGKQTIAEAAGDEATLERLRELGVDFAQGYHIARPKPARAPLTRAA